VSRQGGDAISVAFPIDELPFTDAGSTAGYADDYDVDCPFPSNAPDVVYSYDTTVSIVVSVDLCGSGYDTKIYIYDSELNAVACNDDFYYDDLCGNHVSKIEDALLVPGTYYIVIDGYWASHGDYIFTITGYEPCDILCPPGAFNEDEPPLIEDYVDLYNGGCNTDSEEPLLQEVPGDANGSGLLCGMSGWYSHQGSFLRDTDWFLLTMGPSGTIDVEAYVEQTTDLFELGPQDCSAVEVIQSTTVAHCSQATMIIGGYAPGQTVWFWVGPSYPTYPPLAGSEYDYVIHFTGLNHTVVVQSTTWSAVKALYN
jgi:hypothetical protein